MVMTEVSSGGSLGRQVSSKLLLFVGVPTHASKGSGGMLLIYLVLELGIKALNVQGMVRAKARPGLSTAEPELHCWSDTMIKQLIQST